MGNVPKPYYERGGITIYIGDNREVLPHIEPVHAVVTDPPYGLSFMGKGWDHQVPGVEFWQAIGEAMLPGAHLLSFGGTRTYHRMAVVIEDAGYEIRDTLQWLYGSGFPKSHDVSKAIDKLAGAEREVVGYDLGKAKQQTGQRGTAALGNRIANDGAITAPATPEAEQWQGWGTALKPAYEPIIMARLPFKGTVAQNVLAHGTGAINVDACRIDTNGEAWGGNKDNAHTDYSGKVYGAFGEQYAKPSHPQGRWPANVILDEAAAEVLDAQSGPTSVTGVRKDRTKFDPASPLPLSGRTNRKTTEYPNDSGGPSRFFYVAKASRRERNAGLSGTLTVKHVFSGKDRSLCEATVTELQRVTSGIPAVKWLTGESGESIMGQCQQGSLSTISTAIKQIIASKTYSLSMPSHISESTAVARCEAVSGGSHAESAESSSPLNLDTTSAGMASDQSVKSALFDVLLRASNVDEWHPATNIHSTVKPLALMRYLIQMITPPEGIVLDPFAGSGSTLVAAAELGFNAIGIELSEEYAEIAARRIGHALNERAGKLPL